MLITDGKNMMALDEREEQGKVVPDGTRDHSNGKKESPEKEEPSVDLLQWYLKMIIESDEGKKG
jgi:hypothetical protein